MAPRRVSLLAFLLLQLVAMPAVAEPGLGPDVRERQLFGLIIASVVVLFGIVYFAEVKTENDLKRDPSLRTRLNAVRFDNLFYTGLIAAFTVVPVVYIFVMFAVAGRTM